MQQAGGSHFGVPPLQASEKTLFLSPIVGSALRSSNVLGISSVDHSNPDPQAQQLADGGSPRPTGGQQVANFHDLVPEDDGLAGSANRWPRQETLALLKIWSEMNEHFRDATLKGPLWDQVSRKLAELGYKRSAKKCKEKFENVQKYYKRTKEGRQDGKSYRFFTELEALHSNSSAAIALSSTPVSSSMHPSPSQTLPSNATPPLTSNQEISPQSVAAAADISFSSGSSSEEDGYDEKENEGRKRKHGEGEEGGAIGSRSKKMRAFFDGLVKELIEKQETMQRQFLETIEKREQERTAWRRQEMARLSREQELLAQERAAAASRDAALIAYLKKISSDRAAPSSPAVATEPPPLPETASVAVAPRTLPLEQWKISVSGASREMIGVSEQQEGAGSLSYDSMSSSRWPKAEVHALIDIRSGFESRYQEAGPKGALWEEISAEMQKMGYNRNAKRCKEKWENINKYFKKVKESNKKRPEDAKTCPYFHQLDALYRRKQQSVGGDNRREQMQENTAMPVAATEGKNGSEGAQLQSKPSFFEEGIEKPEDIMKKLMQQHGSKLQ